MFYTIFLVFKIKLFNISIFLILESKHLVVLYFYYFIVFDHRPKQITF